MITKCFNPACQAPFDYRSGRLVRFSGKNQKSNGAENHSCIEHFWLCGDCSTLYTFECKAGTPVELRRQEKVIRREEHHYLVTYA